MNKATLLMGNIGTGKSTYAAKLHKEKGYMVVNNDALITLFAGGAYHYDKEKKLFYQMAEMSILQVIMTQGFDTVIDRTCMTRKTRRNYLNLCATFGYECHAVNFGKGNEASLERRITDPKGISAERWIKVHDSMAEQFQPPVMREGFASITDIDLNGRAILVATRNSKPE